MVFRLKTCHIRTEIRWLLLISVVCAVLWLLKRSNSIQSSSVRDPRGLEQEEKWKLSALWVEDQRPHLNPHRYRYIVNEPNFCDASPDLDLLVLVASAPAHFDQRNAIRATWGAEEHTTNFKAKVLFLLGQGKDGQHLISKESEEFRDIVQEDFQDTYRNLTLKTVMGLKWSAIFCPQAKFVMKTDDDIFVNLPFLHDAIAKNEITRITGCIKNGPFGAPQPIPDMSRNTYLDISQLPTGHPAFTAGAGYVIPGSLVRDLYVAALSTKMFPVEDVFTTAHCAKRIGAHPPQHDLRFSCGEMVLRDCHMSAKFTGHRITADRQFTLFETIHYSDKCKLKENWDIEGGTEQ